MTSFMEHPEFLNCFRFKNSRIWRTNVRHHFRKRLGEFSGRIQRGILALRFEMKYSHYVILIVIDKCHVDRYGVGWSARFTIIVTHHQEVTKPLHSLIAVRYMQVGKAFKKLVFSVFPLLKPVSQKNAMGFVEVPSIECDAIVFEKDVPIFSGLRPKPS